MDLPVQADRPRVLLLQPVHAEVASAGLGVLGVGQAQVEEDAAVLRPGADAGQQRQVDVAVLQDDLLHGSGADLAWRNRAQAGELAERVAQAADAVRELRAEQLTDALTDLVEPIDAERAGHPPLRAEQVDGQREPAAAGALEQQRRAALTHHSLDDPGHLEVRIHRDPDPRQVAVGVQRAEEGLQIGERHPVTVCAYRGAMLIRLGGLFALVSVALWLWGVFDSITAPADRVRLLPKVLWVVAVLLLFDVGAVLWFVFGRPRRTVSSGARRSTAPDDDPEFLRRLGDDVRRRRDDES